MYSFLFRRVRGLVREIDVGGEEFSMASFGKGIGLWVGFFDCVFFLKWVG